MSSLSSLSNVPAPAEAAPKNGEVDEKNEPPPEKVDEQVEGIAVAVEVTKMELTDPAILEVRGATVEQRRLTYTREELIKLRDSPFSLMQPTHIDFTNWSFGKKRAETPAENGKNEDNNHKRRTGGGNDPKERLRKEQDRIVLSPQRESFNHGCFVPAGRESLRTTTNRSHSPLTGGKTDGGHTATRRIGSGRIIRDPWDDDFGAGFRRDSRNNDERFERRSFGRDFEVNRDKEKDNRHIGRGNTRYNDRRRISSDNKEEEPEWFSGGPVSQTDTIELRGFEDSEKLGGIGNNKKKQTPAQKKRAATAKIKITSEAPILKKTEEDEAGERKEEAAAKVATTAVDLGGGGDDGKTTVEDEKAKEATHSLDFFFNEAISGLLTNGVSGEGDASSASSRFTQFFKREKSPPVDSRRSSLQDNTIIRNVLKDIVEPNVAIPPQGDSNSYFAPISPAANTTPTTGTGTGGSGGGGGGSKPINDLVEMLQRSREGGMVKNAAMGVPGKLLHLEEIEANMRQQGGEKIAQQSTKTEDDMTAFRRLLAQMQLNSNNGTTPQKAPPMTLMEMLSHSQQQDEVRMAAAAHHHMLSPNNLHQQQQQQHDLAIKLQHLQNQVQQRNVEMLSKMMSVGGLQASVAAAAAAAVAARQLRTSPLPTVQDIGAQQARELLNRPEAQAILQGLQCGDITPQHLHQQLYANPAMQPRHRELLVTILKVQQQRQRQNSGLGGGGGGGGGVGSSPRVLSPVPPPPPQTQTHVFQQQQQQQQLRVSPLPQNAMHQRIPSPRELQVHTQNILQRALIKKKLEEQQENYRKKQEMQLQQQRGQSPNSNNNNNNNNNIVLPVTKSISSPTPLAFTPTSVLRKMTADKEDVGNKDGGKDVKTVLQQQQGRAVTGVRPQVQSQQQQQQQSQMQQQQWNTQFSIKQTGRPILKSNTNYQQSTSVTQNQQEQFYQQQQQQQRLYNVQQQRQKQYGNLQQSPSTGQYPSHSQYNTSNQYNQLTQQQLRAQHQQHVRSQQQQQQQPPYNQQQRSSWLQMLNQQQQNYDDRTASTTSHHGRTDGSNSSSNTSGATSAGGGGDLSPTSNQLARWFSPTLLEKARAGKLPNMPSAGLAQHALSLEEIERQTAAPVHN